MAKKKLIKFATSWITLAFVLSLITATVFLPASYASAFPGQNGKFVATIDPTGSWNLDSFELYVISENASGKNLKRLTNNSEFEYYPAWSPDGKEIAFSRRDSNGNYDIYVMKANGTQERKLTDTPIADELIPSWSPDGEKIAVSSCPEGDFDFNGVDYNCMDIFVMDADGTNMIRLTDNDVQDYGPAWSPDGGKIAFASNGVDNDTYDIYVMDASDGSNLTNLTNSPAGARDGYFAPYWSPDGTKITFTSDRDGNWQIYVMDADGSNQTNLTQSDSSERISVWSADGQKIAFKSNRDDGNWEIYTMNTDGSDQTRVTNSDLQVRILDWQSLGHKTK